MSLNRAARFNSPRVGGGRAAAYDFT